MIIRAAKRVRKKGMIYANGIGPVRKKINRRLVRRIVGRADVITLRDDVSAEELKNMGVVRDDIRVTSDPVFTLNGVPRDEAAGLLRGSGIPHDSPLSASPYVNGQAWGRFMKRRKALRRYLRDLRQDHSIYRHADAATYGISRDIQRR